jgi:hypothetical protein
MGVISTPPYLKSGARYTRALCDLRETMMLNLVVELEARGRALFTP